MTVVRELAATDRVDAVALWEVTGLTRPWNDPDADFDRAVAGSTSAVLGAFVDDVLRATAMVGSDGHRGWVYYGATDPTQQRRGLGRVMMAAAEAWLTERGMPKVQLMVRTENLAATGFYEALGYEVQATQVFGRWVNAS